MALIKCPECGNNVSDKSDKCVHCGFPIYMQVNMSIGKKKCSYCGCINEKYQNNCKNCGASFTDEVTNNEQPVVKSVVQSQSQPTTIINNNYSSTEFPKSSLVNRKAKDKLVSFWLCLFLGMFGAHKFYEGKTGMGVLYLFTGGLFCFGWFFDCIALLFKPNPYYVY